MEQDIRYKQRFENFEKSFFLFERTVKIKNPSEAERMWLIQSFEIAFELAWKTLKDYLGELGYDVKSPRDVIKQAFQDNIIWNGDIWMRALKSRNESVHVYDEVKTSEICDMIHKEYFWVIKDFYIFLKSKYE